MWKNRKQKPDPIVTTSIEFFFNICNLYKGELVWIIVFPLRLYSSIRVVTDSKRATIYFVGTTKEAATGSRYFVDISSSTDPVLGWGYEFICKF